MSRTLKNIIMIIALVVMLLLISVTVYKATNERVVVGNAIGNPNGMGGNPMNNGAVLEGQNLVFPDGTIMYPDRTGVKADGTPLTQEEIDALMPDMGGMGTPPDGVGGGGAQPMQTTINDLSMTYYIYFGVENLVFLLILAYLILSKFNAKGFSETFDDKLKFILLGIIAIFGTAILTYACGFISDVVSEKIKETKEAENESQNPQMGMQGGTMGTETTDPNAGVTPEGGENVVPEGNPDGMDPNVGVVPDGSQGEMVPGTEVQPGEIVAPNENPGEVPPTDGGQQPGMPGEGAGMPPQMP